MYEQMTLNELRALIKTIPYSERATRNAIKVQIRIKRDAAWKSIMRDWEETLDACANGGERKDGSTHA